MEGALTTVDEPVAERDRLVDRARPALGLLAGVVVLRAAVYAVFGAKFFLDDWSYTTFLKVFGEVHTSDFPLVESTRPGMWISYELFYRIAGQSPVVLLVILTVLNVAVAWAMYAVLRRFLYPRTALVVPLVWVLMPTHNSLALWGATTQVSVALLCLLGGVYALSRGRWIVAAVVLPWAVWSYELFGPLALVAPLVVPSALLLVPADREVRLWQRGIVLTTVGLACLRSILNPIFDIEPKFPDLPILWSAHFGEGLFASSSLAFRRGVGALVAAGVLAALWSYWRGRRGREDGPTLVVVGAVLFLLGSAGTTHYPMQPYGTIDRVFVCTSIGAAFVFVGLLRWISRGDPTIAACIVVGVAFTYAVESADASQRWLAWLILALVVLMTAAVRRATGGRHGVGAVVAVCFVVVCLVGEFVSVRSWSRAGADVEVLLRAMAAADDGDHTTFVVGPVPIRNGVESLIPLEAHVIYVRQFPHGEGDLIVTDDPGQYAVQPGTVFLQWADLLGSDQL